jgi:hypothetical protein
MNDFGSTCSLSSKSSGSPRRQPFVVPAPLSCLSRIYRPNPNSRGGSGEGLSNTSR